MHDSSPTRLERSCAPGTRDWIRTAPPQPGLERLEAYFAGHGYDPHRHDTYAIGLTLSGVQAFGYRGTTLHSLAGQAVVLHPDERHDGRAGTREGFRYRIAYIDPRLIQQALGDWPRPLPFVREAVSCDARLVSALADLLSDLEAPLEELQRDEAIANVAGALAALDPTHGRKTIDPISAGAVAKARDFLDAHIEAPVTSSALETVTSCSRFVLARHFRACVGTSPYRYVIMRRLDRARHLMLSGVTLADAAAASGFADQSHMTRHFKRAYGVSPGLWLKTVAGSRL